MVVVVVVEEEEMTKNNSNNNKKKRRCSSLGCIPDKIFATSFRSLVGSVRVMHSYSHSHSF